MSRRKGLAAAALAAALIGGVALAAWIVITVSTLGPSTFNTASVVGASDLALRDETCTTGKNSDIWPAMLDATPGTRVEGVSCACNDGSEDLVYAITSTNTSAPLAAALVTRVTSAGPGTSTTCEFPTLNLDGTPATVTQEEVYYGPLADLAAGDPAEGVQAGDRTLTAKLTPGACEKLCVSVVLPDTAGPEIASLANDTDVLFTHHGLAP